MNGIASTGFKANCNACTVSGLALTCSGCTSAYALSGGNCVSCAANCKTNNCITAGAGKCDGCLDGFGILASDGSCGACASNCLLCSSNGANFCDVGKCKPTFYNNGDNSKCL